VVTGTGTPAGRLEVAAEDMVLEIVIETDPVIVLVKVEEMVWVRVPEPVLVTVTVTLLVSEAVSEGV